MPTIHFATTNSRKLAEANAACGPFGITVEAAHYNIDEIQSADFVKVATNKAAQAFTLAKRPVVVADTAWQIPALNGFPGAYMKEVAEWLEPADFQNLLRGKTDRRISFIESIVYQDTATTKVFSRSYWGEIVAEPRGTGNHIEQLAAFDGKTIAEQRDNGQLSHDPKDFIWTDFARWFINFYQTPPHQP